MNARGLLLSALVILLSGPMARAASFYEIESEYLRTCGGQVYSRCDGENGRSQYELFREANADAFAQHKRVYVQFGSDESRISMSLDHALRSSGRLERLTTHFIYMHVNVALPSGRAVLNDLKICLPALPMGVVYEPATGALGSLDALQMPNIEEGIERLIPGSLLPPLPLTADELPHCEEEPVVPEINL